MLLHNALLVNVYYVNSGGQISIIFALMFNSIKYRNAKKKVVVVDLLSMVAEDGKQQITTDSHHL